MTSATTTAILTGPTASGKSALALDLCAQNPNIEIINADSIQVYRGMDIGSAKPSLEEQERVPHHLIDVRDPDRPYTAGDFYRDVSRAMHGITSRGHRALIVGGTGFYLKALLYGLWDSGPADLALREKLEELESEELLERLRKKDPTSAARIALNDRYRLIRALEIIQISGKTPTQLQEERPQEKDPRFRLLVVDRDNAELHPRIATRTKQMLQAGLIEETKALRERYPDARALQSVGYAQVIAHLDGITPPGRKIAPGLAGLEEEITLATRQLVKRQRTWFRGEKSAEWFTLDAELSRIQNELKEIYS